MRTLKFIVNKQIIEKDPSCDFSGLVPGTSGYLRAEFSFSPEWDGCAKVAKFHYKKDEFPPQIIENGVCMIPVEAAELKAFKISVLGKGKKGYKISSNDVTVFQDGGIK